MADPAKVPFRNASYEGQLVWTQAAMVGSADLGEALATARRIRILYDTAALNGYLFAPNRTGEARATVIFPCGHDTTAEAGWTNIPAAVTRGYNALVFEGPGPGDALCTQRLFLRPNFEHVLTPVLDWLMTRPDVHPGALVLVGRSFAGYLPRPPRSNTAADTRELGHAAVWPGDLVGGRLPLAPEHLRTSPHPNDRQGERT